MSDSSDKEEKSSFSDDEVVGTPNLSADELEKAGQALLFAGENNSTTQEKEPSKQTKKEANPYRVLARKYRPQTFSELIGQEAMVQTLKNAIERDRLAHAFLMTGVRGVGKTTTARLIAKALNCVGSDGQGMPTINPCGVCDPCESIAEGRHIDVIEMDAASHTGVDDVREIIEQVKYSAVSARYKIYIIDEVHMLSRNAFNALLKTLEEPPSHVKFLFATTEVEKLPVTVLSRTQRFDLRRIPTSLLRDHFSMVCKQEGVVAAPDALQIIASAAEGSVRDGLSILDQAIAHADLETDGLIKAAKIRDMLGLADKSAQRELFRHILDGDGKSVLAAVDEQYAFGVEPIALLRALMDFTHLATVAKVSGSEPDTPNEEERAVLTLVIDSLSLAQLHRLWQLLLKGYEEVRLAPDPLASAQMALLRVMHASDMPDPGQLTKYFKELVKKDVSEPTKVPSTSSKRSGKEYNWNSLVRSVEDSGHLRIAQIMRDWVQVVDLSPNSLLYVMKDGFKEEVVTDLRHALFKTTGSHWRVEEVEGKAAPTLREQENAQRAERDAKIKDHPLVRATFEAFQNAELLPEGDRGREDNKIKRSLGSR